MNNFANMTFNVLVNYDQWHTVGSLFFDDYATLHDDREPFVNPRTRVRWDFARKNLTRTDYDAALAEKEVIRRFVDGKMHLADEATC